MSQAGGSPETPDRRILAQEIKDLSTLAPPIRSTENWVTVRESLAPGGPAAIT